MSFIHAPSSRFCRYSDCQNSRIDLSNVCPHDEENEQNCNCWITCNKCREFCGLEPLEDKDFPTTLREVA